MKHNLEDLAPMLMCFALINAIFSIVIVIVIATNIRYLK